MAKLSVRRRMTTILAFRRLAVLCVLLMIAFATVVAFYYAERRGPEETYEPTEETREGLLLPKGSMQLGGTPVSSLAQAELLVGYEMATPMSLPSGYSLAGIRVEAPRVTLIYSSQRGYSELPPILDMLTLLDRGYWFFQQRPADAYVEPIALIETAVKDGFTKAITVNGAPGFITCAANASSLEWWSEDGTYHKFLYSCIHWWSQGKHYALIAPTNATYFQMVEFAKSVSI